MLKSRSRSQTQKIKNDTGVIAMATTQMPA
jgi:hypothetical protein